MSLAKRCLKSDKFFALLRIWQILISIIVHLILLKITGLMLNFQIAKI